MAKTLHNGNGHKPGHVTETPDVSHIKNLDVTHEVSDVSVSGVLKFVAGLTVLTAAVFVLMWGMFRFMNAEAEKEPEPGPMAMTEQERLPPPPRLQAARGFEVQLENGERVNLENKEPEAEYRLIREQWERRLKCTDPNEHSEAKIIAKCVPIDQAMQKVVGLPSRVKTISEEGPGWRAEDYGIDAPTAASSGRMTVKGK